MRYIHAHCASSEIQSTFFKNIEKVFWNAFKELCNSIFRDCEDLELYSVNSLCLMFASFYNYEKSHVLSRKITRVKFPDSSVVEELATTSKRHERDTLVLALDGTFVADITDPIVQCAFDLCVVGCTAFISNKSFLHLKFLSEMCSTFACNDLFEILLKRCGLLDSSKEDASTDASFKFFEHFVVKWLLSLECEETEVVTSAVKLLFSVFRCVEEADQKLVILNEICHLKSLSILEEVVKTMLPMSSDYDVAQRWFQGTNFNLLILESVKMLILVARSHSCQNIKNPQTSQVWDLLTLCLTTPVDDSEIILPDSYVGQLLMQLHNLLIYISDIKALDNSFIQEMLVNFCKFSHHFFKNVPFCWKFSESYNVLLSLFKLSCGKVQCDAELHDEIQNTWTTGVRSLISTQEVEKPRNFLNSAAGYIHNLIFFDQHPAYNFEMMSCAVVSLLKITKECLFTESSLEEDFMSKFSLLDELIHLMLPTEEEWDQMNEKLNQIIVLGDIINGKLFFSSLLSITEQYHSSDIPLAFSILTFDIFDELFSKDIVSRISNFERFSIHLMGVLNTATYCRLAKESIKNPSVIIFGKDSTYWAKVFDTRIKYVFHSMLLKQFGLQFLKNCLHKAQLKGGLWAHCLLEVVSFLMDYNFTINLKKLLDVNLALESDFGLHVIQILSSLDPKLNLEILSSFFKEKCNDYMLPTLSSARYIVIISTFLDAMPEHAFEMSDVSDIVVKTMDVLVRWKNSDIFASGLSGEWESLCINMEMAKTMSIIVIKYHQMLSSKHWDFILCHLGSSIQSLNECCKTDLLPEVKLFGGIIFHLTAAVGKTMNDFSSSINEVYNLPPDLITEWNEFFSHPLFSSLLDIFVKTTYRCDFSHQISLGDSYFFEIIVESLKWIPSNVIINNDLPLLLNAQWDDSDGAIPVKVKTVLNYLCPLLVSFVHDVQLGAHAILSNLMFALPQYDGHSNEKDDTKTFPGALLEVLLDSHKFVQVLLRDVKFGELFILDPVTDINSYKFLSGYLYSWNLILQMFISASSELRSKYANYLRESRLSDNLMRCLFSLMPNNPSLSSEHIYQKGSSRSGCPHLRSLFSEPPTLHLKCKRF